MSYVLECKDVYKSYKSNKASRLYALNGVSLQLEGGKILGLLGPNGSGKTTLIKVITGLLQKDRGEVFVSGSALSEISKGLISYLPDKNFLSQSKTVEKHLRFFEEFFEDFDIQRAYKMLEELQIAPDRKIKTLSKGTQEKVALILIMSRRAQLYILDEPIAAVDPATRDYILKTILSNYETNASIIISTHLIADVESILSDVLFIKDGQVILSDSAEQIRERESKSIDELFREVYRCL